ncbi:hypothetical protein B0H19DRAFT_313556 [Mycena capillaripes]|nr:hypothetical protein B0H19DRAFT_313556 [Mycena capillaripes]
MSPHQAKPRTSARPALRAPRRFPPPTSHTPTPYDPQRYLRRPTDSSLSSPLSAHGLMEIQIKILCPWTTSALGFRSVPRLISLALSLISHPLDAPTATRVFPTEAPKTPGELGEVAIAALLYRPIPIPFAHRTVPPATPILTHHPLDNSLATVSQAALICRAPVQSTSGSRNIRLIHQANLQSVTN